MSGLERVDLSGSEGHALSGWARGRGPVRVLLLHGIGDHARIWDPVLAALPLDVRALALDFRGHGDSAWCPAGAYERSAFARDLECVIAGLGGPPLLLVGHSLGGSLALRYAARHPERVAALAMLDVGPRIERAAVKRIHEGIAGDESAFASVEERIEQLRRRYWLADPARLAEFARLGLRRSEVGGFVSKVDPATRRLLRSRPPGVAPHDEWADLRAIRCPALVVRAAGSAVLSRATADRMVNEALPDGQLVEVPRCGHALLLDNAPGTVQVLQAFLEPLLAAGGGPAAVGSEYAVGDVADSPALRER